MVISTKGEVDENGNIKMYSPGEYRKELKTALNGKKIIFKAVEFNPFSDEQRRYYFGVICKEARKAFMYVGYNYSLNDVDLFLRDLDLYYEVVNPETGLFEKHLHTLKRDSTEVTPKRMREYTNFCIIWVAKNLDYPIPYPNETKEQTKCIDKSIN